LADQAQTKAVYDKLIAQKDQLEAHVGALDWERMDRHRASRLAIYRYGQVSEEKKWAELCQWAVETMPKFYNALLEPAEKAIREVKQA
jgi:hypothetical protein